MSVHPEPLIASVELVAERCRQIPQLLREQARRPPGWPLNSVPASEVLTTGVGLSEGPARVLAHLVRARVGIASRFVPLSRFALGPPAVEASTVVVFSQGLCPNARLGMEVAARAEEALIITGLEADELVERCPGLAKPCREGRVRVLTIGPVREDRLLLRVQAPAVATFTAFQLADALAEKVGAPRFGVGLREVPETVAAVMERELSPSPLSPGHWLGQPIALVGADEMVSLLQGGSWKLMEGLWRALPPVFEALQYAHGPFQAYFGKPLHLVALFAGTSPALRELGGRLSEVARRAGHTLEVVWAVHADERSLFEFDAVLNRRLIEALHTVDRDLSRWPGHGQDGPLYTFEQSWPPR
ncbi:hypothetical protein DL240_17520 [Lujinxingia litoralis]|uniref:SIS domain-containing protein n=1 Tax=Lujinxingia litoralis TaxID=2211119 RepID=A0A328C5U4_9DELT|nr:hypothetical protein [Lujinxingia litoralis]RAL20380.1 hypothetical protein DL240_17520 [Lujinxingia litoralis]